LCEEKVEIVGGDLTRERLGLSADEYESLTRRVTLVVNSAATVTFDERVDWAMDLNALGPRRLLRLAQDCGNVPFLHVSTCYVCGARSGTILEDSSAPEPARESLPRDQKTGGFDLEKVLAGLRSEAQSMVERFGSDSEAGRRALIEVGMAAARRHGWNDTYTFTKWIGEQLLIRDRGEAPLVIFRPAIIESSLEEPLPGWIDGLRMADPVIVAYGRGKLREFPGRPDTIIDFIPVDFVANAMIAALSAVAQPGASLAIYQCGSSERRPLPLQSMLSTLERAFRDQPMGDEQGRPVAPGRLRLMDGSRFVRKWESKQRRLLRLQRLLRSLRLAARKARRMGAQSRQIEQILYFAKIYAPYTHMNCRFSDDALRALRDKLHPADQREFSFDVESLDWSEYLIHRHVPGLRSFVLGGGGEPNTRLRAEPVREATSDDTAPSVHEAPSLFEAFRRSALRRMAKPALQVRRDGRWLCYTYRDALSATGSIMQRFLEFGLVPGDRVALCAENGPEWGLTYFAAMRAGLTAVPLDPQRPAAEAWSAARFAEVKLLCAGSAQAPALRDARSEQDAAMVTMAEPFIPPPGASRDPLPDAIATQGSEVASILFTSGTTLAPRAVPLTHDNLLANARALMQVHGIAATDEFLSVLPLYHVFEFTAGLLVPLVSGATITYVEQLKAPQILAAMQATGTKLMLVVPRLLQMFHDGIHRQIAESNRIRRWGFGLLRFLNVATRYRFAKHIFRPIHVKFGGRLRMFVSGGSRLDPALYHSLRALGFTIHEGYGMTETSPVLTVTVPGRPKPGSVGPPLPNVELQVRHVNSDGIGDVWVRGPSVMRGYLNDPDATREAICEGWLRTGDLGRLDEDGDLHLTGRSKDLIVTGAGKNVYPDELEARYADLPHVKEICVFGVPAENGLGDEVHAVVVLDPAMAPELDRSSLEREIRGALTSVAETLPSYQRIRTLHFWDRDLPKTSTLKAKRGMIREMILRPHDTSMAMLPVSEPGSIKSLVAAGRDGGNSSPAWIEVQRILSAASKRPAGSIQPDQHLLLDLGIDSIGKIEVLSAVETAFAMHFDDETAAKIARASDLLTLIGDQLPRGAGQGRRALWGRWFSRNGRGPAGPPDVPRGALPFRWLARGVSHTLMHSYLRVRAIGREYIPLTGSFILAPNHSSHLDAPSVLTAVGGRRRVWVAAAEDYFFDKVWKRFVFGHFFDAVAVDRGSDGLQGLRRCADVMDRGDGLLIFPEGTRSLSGRMQPFKIGASLLAVERHAPIVPVHIDHAFELLPKGRRWPAPGVITVTFAPPLAPPTPSAELADSQAACRELTRLVESAVAALAAGAARS
jgi:long-chain acyl-CoA synthetase